MSNIKITIAYDGTNYHGFQEQRGTRFRTVQGVLEEKLSRLAKMPLKIFGAGRTDAGVHARGQVIHFAAAAWPVPVERTVYAVNSLLPRDIVALRAETVPAKFHARFSAMAKTYCYTFYKGKWPSPFHRLYSYHVPGRLELDKMQEAASFLEGRHDFSSFRALGTPVKTTVRSLYQARIVSEGDFVRILLRAEGFLYHMARMIAGTLWRVGLGKLPAAELPAILASCDSLQGGPTMPARGLCLESVEYP